MQSEMLYIYDLEKPRTFGIINQILQGTRTEFFEVHKTRMNGIPWDECNWIMNSWGPCVILMQLQLTNNSSFNVPPRQHLNFKTHTTKEEIWFNKQSHHVLSHHQQLQTSKHQHYLPINMAQHPRNFNLQQHHCYNLHLTVKKLEGVS